MLHSMNSSKLKRLYLFIILQHFTTFHFMKTFIAFTIILDTVVYTITNYNEHKQYWLKGCAIMYFRLEGGVQVWQRLLGQDC